MDPPAYWQAKWIEWADLGRQRAPFPLDAPHAISYYLRTQGRPDLIAELRADNQRFGQAVCRSIREPWAPWIQRLGLGLAEAVDPEIAAGGRILWSVIREVCREPGGGKWVLPIIGIGLVTAVTAWLTRRPRNARASRSRS